METIDTANGKYTLLHRSFEREENGGHEEWLIDVENVKIHYLADIRIPGLYNSAIQEMPEKREKVCIIDFFSEKDLGVMDPFKPTNEAGYNVKSIFSAISYLTINIIEPIRHFRYVAMPSAISWKTIHEYYINKLGSFASEDIVKGTYDVLNPGLQKEIDMGLYCCSVGDLYTNPTWRFNNKVS